jgi:hypothetical protein
VAKEVTTTKLDTAGRLAVQTKDCYVLVSLQEPNMALGPYGSLREAQSDAIRYLVQRTHVLTLSVFKIVGTVTRPAPDLQWTEPAEDDTVKQIPE